LLGVIVLLRRVWVSRHYGQMFAFWMVWYGLQRFLIDFARLGAARDGLELPDGSTVEMISDSVMGPFTGSQWGGLGAAALGVLLLVWTRRNPVVSADADVSLGAGTVSPDAGAPGEDAPPEMPGATETEPTETEPADTEAADTEQ
jgi:hypothetical protein